MRLKSWRTEAGISQEEMAKRLGVSRSYLNQVENGKRSPGERLVNTFRQLCERKEIAEDDTRLLECPPRFELKSESGVRAAFEFVVEKMPLQDLINRIGQILAEESRPMAERISMTKEMIQVAQRRLNEMKERE